MNKLYALLLLTSYSLLISCSPVKTEVSNQYQLERFSIKKVHNQDKHLSLLVSQPDAIAGYQTEQMIYTDKPFELNNFVHNAWVSSPANMLYPLISQSLEQTHYFYAVSSSLNSEKTDYRLDTQVIKLKQNFLHKPSVIEFTINAVLSHMSDNRIVASRMISEQVACPEETPYGGVLAANEAAFLLTRDLTDFVIKELAGS